MSLRQEIETLRAELKTLADQADARLTPRYRLWHPPGQRRTLYRRFRKSLGRLLRQLHLRPATVVEPWLAGLKHVDNKEGARPLIIWAQDIDRDELRQACHRIDTLLGSLPGWAPVLVTDVADFAFYSRLGWLVEYLPSLNEPADNYFERKRKYLAWRYRDAISLPVSVGSYPNTQPEDLLLD
jgi:hypothetical protein